MHNDHLATGALSFYLSVAFLSCLVNLPTTLQMLDINSLQHPCTLSCCRIWSQLSHIISLSNSVRFLRGILSLISLVCVCVYVCVQKSSYSGKAVISNLRKLYNCHFKGCLDPFLVIFSPSTWQHGNIQSPCCKVVMYSYVIISIKWCSFATIRCLFSVRGQWF